jgi:MOSC domain-containing protein YiiM
MAMSMTGFYLKVLREGEVGAGDAIELMSGDAHAVSVADIAQLYRDGTDEVTLLQRAVQVEALPENWREHFQQRIEQLHR